MTSNESTGKAQSAKPRLLVVDDESAMCEVMSVYFEHLGLDVKVAKSAAVGTAFIEEGEFDLAILDWKLDGGADGLDLLKLSKDKHPQIPIIIFTGAEDNEKLLKSAVAGQAEAVLRKTGSLSGLANEVFHRLKRP